LNLTDRIQLLASPTQERGSHLPRVGEQVRSCVWKTGKKNKGELYGYIVLDRIYQANPALHFCALPMAAARSWARSWSTRAPETSWAFPLTRRMATARAQIPRRPPPIPSCWGNLPWPTWTNKSRQKILNQELQVISSVVQLSPQWQGGRRSPWLPARNSNAQCDERPFLPRSRIATLP
jgi:hypothetical protein